MSAVDELVTTIKVHGYYTARQEYALRLMAANGVSPEAAAVVLLAAMREHTDPIQDAWHLVKLARAANG